MAVWLNISSATRLTSTPKNPAGLTPLGVASELWQGYRRGRAREGRFQCQSTHRQRLYAAHAAVAGRSDRPAKALLDHGADVNARNTGGITALMIAAAANEADLASLLIKAGADTSQRMRTEKTALGIARDKGNDAVIKLLEQPSPAAGTSSS